MNTMKKKETVVEEVADGNGIKLAIATNGIKFVGYFA